MFRAHRAHHQERQIVSIQPLVTVILCLWPRCVQVGRRLFFQPAHISANNTEDPNISRHTSHPLPMTHKMISYETWVSKLLPYMLYYVGRSHIYEPYIYIYIYIHLFIHSFIHSFILIVVCLTTGPKPLPKPALHILRSRASSFI